MPEFHLNMDSELLDMLNDIIHSYSDEEYVEQLHEFYHRIESDIGEGNWKTFLLGSLYGQCLFLFNSYYTHSVDPTWKKDYDQLVSQLVKGYRFNLKG